MKYLDDLAASHTHAQNGKVKKSLLFHRWWKCTLKHTLSALQTVWVFLMHVFFLSPWAALIIKAPFTHNSPQMLSTCGSVLSGLDRMRLVMSPPSCYSRSSCFWHVHMDPSYPSIATALGQSLHTAVCLPQGLSLRPSFILCLETVLLWSVGNTLHHVWM